MSGFNLPENMGVIIRTAGMGRTKLELQKDLQMLLKILETIQEKSGNPKQEPPFTVYQVPGMVVRTVRDHYTADTSEIMVDTQIAYKELRSFFKLVMPRIQSRVKFHNDTIPLFTQYKIEEQISKHVISSNQAIIWDCLRSVNINNKISGYGKLLSN